MVIFVVHPEIAKLARCHAMSLALLASGEQLSSWQDLQVESFYHRFGTKIGSNKSDF